MRDRRGLLDTCMKWRRGWEEEKGEKERGEGGEGGGEGRKRRKRRGGRRGVLIESHGYGMLNNEHLQYIYMYIRYNIIINMGHHSSKG